MENEHVEQLRRIADEIANSQRPVEQEAEWLRAAMGSNGGENDE